MKDRIKYIAAYQVKPISAVTHMAEVAEIKPHKDFGKYVVVFKQPAAQVGPIKPKDSKFSPQGPIYVQKEQLLGLQPPENGGCYTLLPSEIIASRCYIDPMLCRCTQGIRSEAKFG